MDRVLKKNLSMMNKGGIFQFHRDKRFFSSKIEAIFLYQNSEEMLLKKHNASAYSKITLE